MKMKKILLLVVLTVLIGTMVSAYDCKPPVDFSVERDCTLRESMSRGINEFSCGDYYIVGDCEGGVISYEESSVLAYSKELKLGFIGMIILLTILGLFVAFRKLKEDDDYPNNYY